VSIPCLCCLPALHQSVLFLSTIPAFSTWVAKELAHPLNLDLSYLERHSSEDEKTSLKEVAVGEEQEF
jgi:hypothetical protein